MASHIGCAHSQASHAGATKSGFKGSRSSLTSIGGDAFEDTVGAEGEVTNLEPTEHQIQCAVIEWRDLMVRTHPQLRWLHAIPNGMRATPEVGRWMVAEGMTRGIPDLCLPVPKKHQGFVTYCGLYIEVKTSSGKVTPEQGECHEFLRANGYRVDVCRSVDTTVSVILGYLGVQCGF